jgi:hypothetical protein
MSTSPRIFIDDLPELGDGARRFTVDCKWSQTGAFYLPGGPIELSERHVISVALQRHEDGCGKCNLRRLWQEYGDPELKAAVDEVWDQLAAGAMQTRRN